jgi:hypothetical protein
LGIFFTAAFFGLALILVSFFLDTEAVFNLRIGENLSGGSALGLGGAGNATIQADQVLISLRCPMVVTSRDKAFIQATVSNPSEKEVIRIFEMDITQGFNEDKSKHILPMAPGQVETLRWEITTENALYGFLILARGFLHPYSSLPSLGGTCGILMLDIPFLTGSQLLWGIIGLSIAGMVTGIVVFIRHNKPLTANRWKPLRAIMIAAGVVTAGMLLIFLEFWYISFFITLITFLLVPAIFLHLVVNN